MDHKSKRGLMENGVTSILLGKFTFLNLGRFAEKGVPGWIFNNFDVILQAILDTMCVHAVALAQPGRHIGRP